MADSALTLLDMQRQTGAQVFGQISAHLNSVSETAQQTARFTLGAATQVFEMKETARMNDAKLAQIQFQDELAAKAHESEMTLMPLRVESERLRLETEKARAENQLRANQSSMFNDVVAPFNTRVGSTFARNQDPGYAKGYLGIQAKWRGHMAAGGKFDAAAYGRDVEELDRSFKDSTPSGDYNPEVSFLLGELGATSEKSRYEAKNPVFKSNMLAIKSGIVMGGGQGLGAMMRPEIGSMFTEDETRSLGMANQAYGSLNEQVEAKQTQLNKVNTAYSAMAADNPARAQMGKYLESLSNEFSNLVSQRDNILSQVLDGKPLTTADVTKPVDALREAVRENLRQMDERNKLLPDQAKEGESGAKIINKQADTLSRTLSTFPEATSGIDFNGIRGVDLESDSRFTSSEKVTGIGRQIRQNLDNVEDVGALFSGEKNKSKLREVFERFKRRVVPNEGSTNQFDPNETPGLFGKTSLYNQPGVDRAYTFGEGGRFETYADLEEFIEDFKGTDNQRRLFLEDIYTSIVLSDIVNSSRMDARPPLLD